MDLLEFYTDGPKSREGVWVDQGGGTRLRIARMDNPAYKACIQEARKTHGRRPDDETTQAVLRQAVAKTVLLEWEGVTIDGEPAPEYTPEYGISVFERLPTFLDLVVNLAYDESLFREEEVEDVVGQLRPTSAGTSSGAAKSAGSKK